MPTTHLHLTNRVQISRAHIEQKQQEVDSYMDSLQRFQIAEEEPQRDTQVDNMNNIIQLSRTQVEEVAKNVDEFIKQKRNSRDTQHYLERIDDRLDIIEHRISAIEVPKAKP